MLLLFSSFFSVINPDTGFVLLCNDPTPTSSKFLYVHRKHKAYQGRGEGEVVSGGSVKLFFTSECPL